MKYAYRVEHQTIKEGKFFAGPYNSEVIDKDKWSIREHVFPKHPCLFSDIFHEQKFPKNWRTDYISGFNSINQLLDWFNQEELTELFNYGFVISKYKIKKSLEGSKQILFIPFNKNKRTIITLNEIGVTNEGVSDLFQR